MDFNIYAAPVNYFLMMMEILLAQLQRELFMSLVKGHYIEAPVRDLSLFNYLHLYSSGHITTASRCQLRIEQG